MTLPKARIRPAARLIHTIGQDLIKDVYAAIVELVKNAYDADSPDAIVEFSYDKKNHRLLVVIEDHGHGMSYDTILNNWLVPATNDKLVRKKSDKGRILQGRKGIGRFAASILGERILVETTFQGKTTSLILDMEELCSLEYLDQFELSIDTRKTSKASGTRIEIEKDGVTEAYVQDIWTQRQLRKLLLELRSLTAPDEVYQIAEDQGFHIHHDTFDMKLVFNNFPVEEYNRRTIDITPFPVLDLYDYKISGTVNNEGLAKLEFENQNHPGLPSEKINISVPLDQQNNLRYPGNIFLDFRVYDRESSSIDNMIKRGLKDPETGEYVGKREARKILDESYGIGIYREQFRIRPYGEQSFDWLDLDKKRVQAPSVKLGYNQVLGFVYIRSEEESGLIEKSARDGLMENTAYFGLQAVVLCVINELEARRNRYREQERKGGRNRSIEDDINLLFDFDNTKQQISKELEVAGVPKSQRKKVDVVVGKVLTKEKEKKVSLCQENSGLRCNISGASNSRKNHSCTIA
ncbi:MAG: ATP-binding protein [Candidatus Thiodiazotropha sp. (ex. Lucinoma kazani)]